MTILLQMFLLAFAVVTFIALPTYLWKEYYLRRYRRMLVAWQSEYVDQEIFLPSGIELILEEQRRLGIIPTEELYDNITPPLPPSDHGVTGARPLPPMRLPETFLDDLPWHEQNRRINDLLMREKTE